MLPKVGLKESDINSLTIQKASGGLKEAWMNWNAHEESKYRKQQEWHYYDSGR